MPVMITLNMIKACHPCPGGWRDVLRGQGKTEADDVEFPLADILTSNTLEDTLWTLRCSLAYMPVIAAFADWCAKRARKHAAAAADAADAATAARAAADAADAAADAADAAAAARAANAAAARAATTCAAYIAAAGSERKLQARKLRSLLNGQ